MLRNKTLRKCYSFSRQIVKQEIIRRDYCGNCLGNRTTRRFALYQGRQMMYSGVTQTNDIQE